MVKKKATTAVIAEKPRAPRTGIHGLTVMRAAPKGMEMSSERRIAA
jgi:hypothetical protein